jgi:hypothetical protein
MGRVDRKPKAVEQFLIREFVCDALHYTISLPEWCESPDAILTLRKGRIKRRVAIEHTGYFNDTMAGRRSPLTPISGFWKRVQTSLGHRISHRKHLAHVTGRVRLNVRRFAEQPNPKTQEELARQFAEEIVDFLEAHPITDSARFPSHSANSPGIEFSDFPMLKSMVASMRIRRSPGLIRLPRCSWLCDNVTTGSIGLNLTYIRTSVARKNKKAVNYDWRSADEKWLLIVAAGGNLSENAGAPEEQQWNDSELRTLCCASPFDRIYFWERIRRWYKSLKPTHRIVCPLRT